MVPLTARDPGRKLGRVGWRKQPETKAQGSARRQLPGGAHGPVPPGTQAQGQGRALNRSVRAWLRLRRAALGLQREEGRGHHDHC